MPRDADQIANLDAELDALETPTTEEVYAVSKDYDDTIVAASAAGRAINGGGGGGGGSSPIRVVRKTILFDDPDILTGVLVATIAVDEIVLCAPASMAIPFAEPVVYIPTVWNGTTPTGTFLGDNGSDPPYGFGQGLDMTVADSGRIVDNPGTPDLWGPGQGVASLGSLTPIIARDGPIDLLFTVDADQGGTPTGATQGEALIVLMILTAP